MMRQKIRRLLPNIIRSCGLCGASEVAPDLVVNSRFVLCKACRADLVLAAHQSHVLVINQELDSAAWPVFCLMAYRGQLREKIVTAKSSSHYGTSVFLRDLFCVLAAEKYPQLFRHVVQLATVPQSMWGRLRFKVDFASLLGDELSLRHRIPLWAPGCWQRDQTWTWKKQSQESHRPRQCLLIEPPQLTGKYDLLIDDVVTSGQTMARALGTLTSSKPGDRPWLGLCLAWAGG